MRALLIFALLALTASSAFAAPVKNYLHQASVLLDDATFRGLPSSGGIVVVPDPSPTRVIGYVDCWISTHIELDAWYEGFTPGMGLGVRYNRPESFYAFVDPETTELMYQSEAMSLTPWRYGGSLGKGLVFDSTNGSDFMGGHPDNTVRISCSYTVRDVTTGLLIPAP